MKEDRQPQNRLSLLFHISPAIPPTMNVREVHLVNHKRPFTEIGCDYSLFHMPGKKDHITLDIHYSLEHHNGIHTEEIDLLEVKESNDLPS